MAFWHPLLYRSWSERPSCSAACPGGRVAPGRRPTSTPPAATSTPSYAEPSALSVKKKPAAHPTINAFFASARLACFPLLFPSRPPSSVLRRPRFWSLCHGPRHGHPPADDGLPDALLPDRVQTQLHHAERQLWAEPLRLGGHLLGGRPGGHQPGQVGRKDVWGLDCSVTTLPSGHL